MENFTKIVRKVIVKFLRIDRYLFLRLSLFLQIGFTFSQTTEIKPNFGIRLTDKEIELPNKYNYLTDIQLQILPKSKSRNYYNDNNEGKYDNDFGSVEGAEITWKKKEGNSNKYKTVIPPLKPNRFYRLVVSYYSSESIVALFLMMHNEKNTNWYSNQKEWMKLLNRISDRNEPFSITYDPTITELYSFKYRIKDIDLNVLDIKENDYIKGIKDKKIIQDKKEELKKKKKDIIIELDKIAKLEFEVLNFDENKNRYTKKDLIEFSKWIQSKSDFSEDDTIEFSSNIINSPDYINVYEFYKKYLIGPLTDDNFQKGELLETITNAVNEEKLKHYNEKSSLLPNYLIEWVEEDITKTTTLSTYSNSFETSYKLSLVPDFGYVAYLNNNDNTPQGGNLFLGVNISLSPSNKNASLQISNLSIKQRLSIHTGVTIGSIAEDNIRDNFFDNYSLLLGGSYKVLTQGTRINFGGLLYNKVNAINGDKSLAIQPYIGLSVDLEIRKWLQTVFPKLKI